MDFDNVKFKEDLFFIKGKGDGILSLAKLIERETNIPVINSSEGIWLAYNRFLNSSLLRSNGIRVPDFSLNPKEENPPFNSFIVKNIRDRDNYAFNPKTHTSGKYFKVKDERAMEEAFGKNAQYSFFYYQKYIPSEFEFKIYGIGENLFYYKQKPILHEPNKMKTRVPIKPIPKLGEIAHKVMDLFNLEITSLDFLKSKQNDFYLTDVNSTPNFNYIKNGSQIVGNYLISRAKR
ncbi:MAG: hypothetical protein EU517_01605 [Promethearchaeota archaeon]|nr:MAG: hypothetical protein EU517_01605 [Candidatus Lokiarchaeota archaeon]